MNSEEGHCLIVISLNYVSSSATLSYDRPYRRLSRFFRDDWVL